MTLGERGGMGHSWFRVYHDMVRDRKVRRLSYEHRWLWIAALTLASESPQRGVLLITDDVPVEIMDLADIAGLDDEAARAGMEHMERLELIEQIDGAWAICNWDTRQFESDDSSGRNRRWRERRAEAAETEANPSKRPRPRLVKPAADATDDEIDPYTPLGVVDAYCRVIGCTLKDLELQGDKGKAFGQAKRLLERGYGGDKVEAIVRWLQSDEFWQRRGVDLGTVLSQAGKWERAGMPASVHKRESQPAEGYGFDQAFGFDSEERAG